MDKWNFDPMKWEALPISAWTLPWCRECFPMLENNVKILLYHKHTKQKQKQIPDG